MNALNRWSDDKDKKIYNEWYKSRQECYKKIKELEERIPNIKASCMPPLYFEDEKIQLWYVRGIHALKDPFTKVGNLNHIF